MECGHCDGYEKDQKLIMHELSRLNESCEIIRGKVDSMGNEIAKLEVKSSMWGAVSGGVTSVLAMAIYYFKSIITKQ